MHWRRSVRCSWTRRPWYARSPPAGVEEWIAAAPAQYEFAPSTSRPGRRLLLARWDGTQTHTEHVEYGIPAEVKVDDCAVGELRALARRDDDRDRRSCG